LRTERESNPWLSPEEVTTNRKGKDQSTRQRMMRTEKNNTKANKHTLSPFQHTTSRVRFRSARRPSPLIDPIYETDEKRHNNVQEISLDTDYYLYQSPDKPIQNQPISIIYDTGAAISMLPADCAHAWRNLRECLHTLTGCFAGHSESNLMIGEFHGILTLDNNETIRVIIPECIQIPTGLSNTYLLSDS
jgi:hypothetical protein